MRTRLNRFLLAAAVILGLLGVAPVARADTECSPCEEHWFISYTHWFLAMCCDPGDGCYNASLWHSSEHGGQCGENHDRCGAS